MKDTAVFLARASLLAACALASMASKTARADTPAPQGATSAPVTSPTPAEIRYRRVSVDVVSTRPQAVVERRVTVTEENGTFVVLPWHDTKSTWEQVCIAPCSGADLDRYSSYRVAAANGISSSHVFTLPQTGDAVHLRLDAGSRDANRLGVALGSLGFVAVVVGGSLALASSSIKGHDDEVRARDAGFITGGAGVVLLAIGIPLAILTRTYVYAGDSLVRAAEAKPRPVGLRFVGNGFAF